MSQLKKLLLIPLLLLLLTGCKIKEYTPEIPSAFTQRAVVSSGDFSFECEICKNEKTVSVRVLNTSAKDMVMSYDGEKVTFTYSDYSSAISATGIEPSNTAVVVYEAMTCLEGNEQERSVKLDSGYQYKGDIRAGEFTLIQNEDNTLERITVPLSELTIEFI